MTAIPRLASIPVVLLALGCGAATTPSDPAQDHASAFRSIGPARLPEPAPPPAPGYAGVHTSYYDGGQPRSHGHFIRRGERSLPHGIWTFWLPDGSRQSQGRFHLGEPVGCFAMWSHGHRVTGLATAGAFEPAACEPPVHETADIVESAHGGEAHPPVDIAFGTFIAPGVGIGVTTTKYQTNDPDMRWAVAAQWRRRVREIRFGAASGVRGGEYEYFAVPAALVGGWGRQLTTWLSIDAWGELGVLVVSAKPRFNSAIGHETLWTPLTAVQADVGWQIAGRLEITLGGRLELGLPREVDRTTKFCSFNCGGETDTWDVGGLTGGLVAGLRFLVW